MTSRLRIYKGVPIMEIHVRKTLKDAASYTVGVNVIAVRQARRPLKAVIDGTVDVAQSLNPNRQGSSLAIGVYYATLGGLAAAEIIDPEIAVIIGVGHLLASSKSPPVHEAGEALQAAEPSLRGRHGQRSDTEGHGTATHGATVGARIRAQASSSSRPSSR